MNPEANYLAAVSSDVPEVALFALEKNALDAGKSENDRGWKKYRQCLESDEWPGRYDENTLQYADISDREKDRVAELEVPSAGARNPN